MEKLVKNENGQWKLEEISKEGLSVDDLLNKATKEYLSPEDKEKIKNMIQIGKHHIERQKLSEDDEKKAKAALYSKTKNDYISGLKRTGSIKAKEESKKANEQRVEEYSGSWGKKAALHNKLSKLVQDKGMSVSDALKELGEPAAKDMFVQPTLNSFLKKQTQKNKELLDSYKSKGMTEKYNEAMKKMGPSGHPHIQHEYKADVIKRIPVMRPGPDGKMAQVFIPVKVPTKVNWRFDENAPSHEKDEQGNPKNGRYVIDKVKNFELGKHPHTLRIDDLIAQGLHGSDIHDELDKEYSERAKDRIKAGNPDKDTYATFHNVKKDEAGNPMYKQYEKKKPSLMGEYVKHIHYPEIDEKGETQFKHRIDNLPTTVHHKKDSSGQWGVTNVRYHEHSLGSNPKAPKLESTPNIEEVIPEGANADQHDEITHQFNP